MCTQDWNVQRCRYCGDYYRSDDAEMAVETDDGWVSDICRPCQEECNESARNYYSAWDDDSHEEDY